MARNYSPANLIKSRAELVASDAAIDPILASSKITVLQVDGKDVPATDAPLPVRITALGKLISTGDKTADTAALIEANGQLAAQTEANESKLTVANSTISAQTQKIASLETQLATQTASVQTLTATLASTENLLKASNGEVARTMKALADQKQALALRCLAANCLDLTGEDGKPLAKEASQEIRLAAAMNLSQEDLFKFYNGAVNAAVSKTGVSFETIPNMVPSGIGQKPIATDEPKGRARFAQAVKIVNG